jgi:DNA-directed RNA polymerase I subunit RPA1
MAAQPLHSKEITTAQVKAVSFGFFSDEEVRRRSISRRMRPLRVPAHRSERADGASSTLRRRSSRQLPPSSQRRHPAPPLTPPPRRRPAAPAVVPQVRKISVLEVSTPVIFDNLKLPARGGLYDPRLGPMEPRERCATCGLGAFECPGHFGRVELAVPLYNPLVFATLIKVLRASCLHCFRLRMAEAEAERFRARLELLAAGRLAEAAALALGSSAAAKRAGVAMAEGEEDMDEGEELVAGKGRSTSATLPPAGAPIRRAAPSGAALEATIEAVGELFRRQPAGKCGNCGAHSPALRREGHAKVFAMPLPPKKRAANEVQGTRVLSVLARLGGGGGDAGDGDALAELETEAGAAERARSAARRAARDVGAGGAAAKPDSSDDDEDEDKAALGSDSDDGKKAGPPAPAAYLDLRQAKLGAAAAAAADAAAAAGGADGAAPAGGPGGADPSYLTPTEVREVLKRVWAANAPLLALVFPAEAARRGRRRRAGAAPARGPAAGWRDFFIQTVPVAPNRFRPLNKVGDAVYEHPQNTLLAKLLAGNLDLLAAARGAPAPAYFPPGAAGAAADAADAADAAATPPDPAAALGRTLRLWLDLQNSLNALLDSSAAEETHGAQGIRQQLEKKEGLFRKNMMGKRVNFACRSVISPDVYLNGGEIGVPPYFASRLSFPERVTPWNLERLREAVVAGPGRNPGAVAVEDERGRVVVLRPDRKSREAVARALGAGVGGGAAGGGGAPGRGAAAGAALNAPATARYGGGQVVYRTMTDGDFMLTNRQPTLHRPGMMGHRARIMRAERTIRFHYANCATFNADFDGDEINLHLPQVCC